jgi:hypothetical protein
VHVGVVVVLTPSSRTLTPSTMCHRPPDSSFQGSDSEYLKGQRVGCGGDAGGRSRHHAVWCCHRAV